MRSKTLNFFVSVIAVAATMVAGSIESAAAEVAPSASDARVMASCSEPPASPDATPENAERFVDLWLPRMRDKAYLEGFVGKDTVPENVKDEGFHAMDEETQVWLTSCLVDAMLDVAGESPDVNQRNLYLTGANLIVFGKQEIKEIKESLENTEQGEPQPTNVNQDQTPAALQQKTEEAISVPSLASRDLPRSDAEVPQAKRRMNASDVEPEAGRVTASEAPVPTSSPLALPPSLLQVFPVPQLLAAIEALLQLIAKIQGVLFTLPGLNVLASAFYKICAESPTMPLTCSVSLPVGVPIPADVTGDNLPDVTGWLSPLTNLRDVGAKFQVQRLNPGSGALPAHVYAVYDPPVVKKRIQFGYDGRASTLGNRTTTTFKLHDVRTALTGDVHVSADIGTTHPGSTQALTFAIKDLVGGSAGNPPAEENPTVGAVQMSPVPTDLSMDARLTHTTAKNQDTFTLNSTTPSTINAVIDQSTTTTTPKSHRRFTALVDKLPTAVTVDVVGEGEHQSIDYTASAPIAHVQASDTATPDVSQPGTYTRSVYDVLGVPKKVSVDLLGAEDITYAASATIPEVSFETQTFETGTLQQQISAAAHGVPKAIHVTNLTTEDETSFTYDADSELNDIVLSMYDLNEVDETNLQATAEGIPTHMEFQQVKSTGVYDFAAPDGIDRIKASLSRNGGEIIPHAGDHATVKKVGEALGLDFQLSGFAGAHLDAQDDLNVGLDLSPGGQSFDAVADLDDPNVLAHAHVSNLPSSVDVNVSPEGESATYTASSPIDQITADILLRDTNDELGIDIGGVPTDFTLQFDADGSTIAWDASDTTGHIGADAHLTPASIGGTRTFDASLLIEDIPATFDASWADGNVLFQAPAPGIGSISAQVTNHGSTHTMGGDHLHAYYRDGSGDLDASLKVSNLRKAAFTKVDGGDGGGFEAALKMGNHGNFSFGADVVLPAAVLKASGNFSNLPSDIVLRSDGGRITYTGNSNPDLTMAVEAGTSQAALNNTPAAPGHHGISVRDGASGTDRAVKARLHLTGLPDHLDLNSPAGIYTVNGYHPSNPTLVVDVALTELTPEDLTLYLTQGVPTASPVDFTFGPFLSETLGDGTHTMKVTYTANQDLGALNANATYGAAGVGDEAQVYIDKIPGGTAPSIEVSAEFGEQTKHVNVTMSKDIGEISAKYKTKGAAEFAASVTLTDVPKTVDLLIGRATGSDGTTDVAAPDFTLKADHAGLDVFATATAKLVEPENIHAAATLDITDMGHLVTGALNGTRVDITSEPATRKFSLIASGGINIDVDLGFSILGGFIQNTGNLNIDFDLKQLTLGFEDASALQLDLGITTGLKGDYRTFTFAEDSRTVATIEDELKLVADLPEPFPDLSYTVLDINPTSIDFDNVIDSFRLASNKYDVVWSQEVLNVGVGSVHAQLLARPHAERTTAGPAFTVEQPPADGNPPAWLITPNPNVLGVTLPEFVVDVVQYFTTPYGRDLGGRLLCDPVGFDPFDCTPDF